MTAAMAAVATPRAATSDAGGLCGVGCSDIPASPQTEKREAIEVHRGRSSGSRSRPADEQHACDVTPDATGQEARREHSGEVRLLGLGHRHRDTGREEERSPPHRPDREGNAKHEDCRCEELPAAVIESPAELPEIELRQDKSEEPPDSRARAPRSSEPLCGGYPPAAMIFVYPYSDDAIGAASHRHPSSNGSTDVSCESVSSKRLGSPRRRCGDPSRLDISWPRTLCRARAEGSTSDCGDGRITQLVRDELGARWSLTGLDPDEHELHPRPRKARVYDHLQRSEGSVRRRAPYQVVRLRLSRTACSSTSRVRAPTGCIHMERPPSMSIMAAIPSKRMQIVL